MNNNILPNTAEDLDPNRMHGNKGTQRTMPDHLVNTPGGITPLKYIDPVLGQPSQVTPGMHA